MKMTEQERELLGLFRQVESRKNQDDVIFHTQAIVRAQDALKADYGLLGPDATLFNGTGVLQSPSYALPGPGPVMEVAV